MDRSAQAARVRGPPVIPYVPPDQGTAQRHAHGPRPRSGALGAGSRLGWLCGGMRGR